MCSIREVACCCRNLPVFWTLSRLRCWTSLSWWKKVGGKTGILATSINSMLKKPASFVLGLARSSTGTRPPHHSAARTDVVLLIRRTVRPRGYASGFDSPAALLYGVLIILRIHRHDVFQSKLLMKGEGGKYVHSREDYEEAAQDGGTWRVDCERGQENEDGAD